MNKSATIVWTDDDNIESFKLAAPQYNLEILKIASLAGNEDDYPTSIELTVYGKEEDVDRFVEDANDGSCEPMESMSRSLEYDEDYEGWLANEIYWVDRPHPAW